MPHGRRPPAFDIEHAFGAGPDNTSKYSHSSITAHCQNGMLIHHHPRSAGLRGFDLAESIWSQESDLTLDDLALESDSASGRSRSSVSSRWSAAQLTPSTSPHLQLPPTRELFFFNDTATTEIYTLSLHDALRH